MRSPKLLFMVMAIFALWILKQPGARADQKASFIKIFKQQECTKCHSLNVYKMGVVPVEDEDEDEDMDEEDTIEAPDLSELSDKVLKSELKPADYIRKFLKKELKRDGKKHKHIFKGSEQEFKILISHLLEISKKTKASGKSYKNPPAPKKK